MLILLILLPTGNNKHIQYTDPTGHSWKSFWKKAWNAIKAPLIAIGIAAATVFTWGAIAPSMTAMGALFSTSGFTIVASAGATTGFLETHPGQQLTNFISNSIFDDIFGMKPGLANIFGNITSYMLVNAGFQFGFARLSGANKSITQTKKYDANSPADQATAKDILTEGKGINYGSAPEIDIKTGQPRNVSSLLYSGNEPVSAAAEALNIGGGSQHLGIVMKGLQTQSQMQSFFLHPFKALSQGYLSFGISHTAVNISLLNAGYGTTINSLLKAGWSTVPSTIIYGSYGGGLTGGIAYEQTARDD